MALVTAVLMACLAATATAKMSCYTNRGENLIQFNGKNQDNMIPCKYAAVKAQTCGKWRFTITPGNRWVYPKYQLDTLHTMIEDMESGKYWEGRITNKLAVKWLIDSKGQVPMAGREGDLSLSDNFKFSVEKKATITMADKKGTFKLQFTPWDPSQRNKFPNSEWRFECLVDGDALKPFPEQMCGDDQKNFVETYAKENWGLGSNFQNLALIFHTFTNPEIAQTDQQCIDTTKSLVKECKTDAQRMNVIQNCNPILGIKNHATCIASKACSPMDIFKVCVEWGCKGFSRKEKDLCYDVADGIDMCAEISNGGNLTSMVRGSNCYNDFLSINPK